MKQILGIITLLSLMFNYAKPRLLRNIFLNLPMYNLSPINKSGSCIRDFSIVNERCILQFVYLLSRVNYMVMIKNRYKYLINSFD